MDGASRLPARRPGPGFDTYGYDRFAVQERFLEALRRCGNVSIAIEQSQSPTVSGSRTVWRPTRQTYYNWRDSDPEFAEAWEAAMSGALGDLQINIHHLALKSRSSEVRLNASKFLLTKLDRGTFGDDAEVSRGAITVNIQVPLPSTSAEAPLADDSEMRMYQQAAPKPLEEAATVNEDGVPGVE